jgi:AcrR family transcriptional regulator
MSRAPNRGPAAAADNRRALLAAARAVLADGGLSAPLNAVARTAGVGQGSLYRHFADRVDLAIAVFDDNVRELEAMAAEPAATLDDLIGLLTRRAIESVAFVDMITADTDDPRLADIGHRVEVAVARKLAQAQTDGRVDSALDAADLTLAVAMVANLVAKRALLRCTSVEQHRRKWDQATAGVPGRERAISSLRRLGLDDELPDAPEPSDHVAEHELEHPVRSGSPRAPNSTGLAPARYGHSEEYSRDPASWAGSVTVCIGTPSADDASRKSWSRPGP